MQKYQNVVLTTSGDVVPFATVTVRTNPGGAIATIFWDDGGTPQVNPITADSMGRFSFYTLNGRYDIEVSGAGISTQEYTDIILEDLSEGTWTPYVGGTATYITQSGRWLKTGNLVTAWFDLEINLIGTGAVNVISGLPFSSEPSTIPFAGSVGYWANMNLSLVHMSCMVPSGVNAVYLYGTTAAAATLGGGLTLLKNSARVVGSVSYRTPS